MKKIDSLQTKVKYFGNTMVVSPENKTEQPVFYTFFSVLLLLLLLLVPYTATATGDARGKNVDILVEPVEGPTDTVRFHIGSPLFLRLTFKGTAACEPFNGQPFYFSADGSQLGWGFKEVTDSLLFPRTEGSCERIIMLSSESSNRLAEGHYTFTLALLMDEKRRLVSDTLIINPLHSRNADNLSYTRFLQEQIVRNSPVLNDPETLAALFSDNLPKSAESEVYRALILYKGGDYKGADNALRLAQNIAAARNTPLSVAAINTAGVLQEQLYGITAER